MAETNLPKRPPTTHADATNPRQSATEQSRPRRAFIESGNGPLPTQSESLIRARHQFVVRNAATGLALLAFATGTYYYSMAAVRQDDLSDIDEKAIKARQASIQTNRAVARIPSNEQTLGQNPVQGPPVKGPALPKAPAVNAFSTSPSPSANPETAPGSTQSGKTPLEEVVKEAQSATSRSASWLSRALSTVNPFASPGSRKPSQRDAASGQTRNAVGPSRETGWSNRYIWGASDVDQPGKVGDREADWCKGGGRVV